MNPLLFGLASAVATLAVAYALHQRADNIRLRKRLEDWQDRVTMMQDRRARLGEAMARDYREQND